MFKASAHSLLLESPSPCSRIFLGLHGNFWQQTKPTIISYFLSNYSAAHSLHLQKIHNNLRHQWERKFHCFYLSLFTLMILDYFLLRALRLSNSIYEISCKRSKTYYSYIFHITLSYTKYIQFGHIKQVLNSVCNCTLTKLSMYPRE